MGYCLLGLFGVNMPMISGEGQKAFLRLQHEIIKASTDQSLFAWRMVPSIDLIPDGYRGAFSWTPANFAGCGRVVQTTDGRQSELTLTNKGLRIEVSLALYKPEDNLWIAFLDCAELENSMYRLGILLSKLGDDVYRRSYPRDILTQQGPQLRSIHTNRATIYITNLGTSPIAISRWGDPREKERDTFVVPACLEDEHGFLTTSTIYYPSPYLEVSENSLGPDLGQKYTSVTLKLTNRWWRDWSCAFKFQHERDFALQFIVLFGITDGTRVWSNLELAGDPKPILNHFTTSYLDPDNNISGLAIDGLSDRAILPLEDGLVVNLAIKKMIISGKVSHVVTITMT